jgi:hypothetical protein
MKPQTETYSAPLTCETCGKQHHCGICLCACQTARHDDGDIIGIHHYCGYCGRWFYEDLQQ